MFINILLWNVLSKQLTDFSWVIERNIWNDLYEVDRFLVVTFVLVNDNIAENFLEYYLVFRV